MTNQPTHDDYIEQFGQTLEALIMIFSASVLMELKQAVGDKLLAEPDAEDLYEQIGERLGDAMAQVDARLAARAADEHLEPRPRDRSLITLHHPEDHDDHRHGDASLPGSTVPPKAPTAP